jgi:DNA (cytosine-5)-methyltransferase 1
MQLKCKLVEVDTLNYVVEQEEICKTTSHIKQNFIPFPHVERPKFTFVDLFAGIGGFRITMQEKGGKCVFSSEWDAFAKKTYEANFGELPHGDIREILEESIPDHDVLCAGFPCQPFSLAGISARNSLNTAHGFACETQGTLFFDVIRIINAKRPKIVFLENVKNIVRHDDGKTFAIIRNTIESLGYSFSHQIIDSSSLVPQKRVRCYMVCIRDDNEKFGFPKIEGIPLALKMILEEKVDDSFTISSKLWEGHQRRTQRNLDRGTGFTAFCADLDKPSNTIVARYGKDGKECLIPQDNKNPRMLTPRECARLQGFPENFLIPVAKTAAYRQFGNSVVIPVIRKIAENILPYLETEKKRSSTSSSNLLISKPIEEVLL